MTVDEVNQAEQTGTEVVVIFDDNKPNPTGVVQSGRPRGRVPVKVTKPARGYSVGDIIIAYHADLRPYSWARTLPKE
jgi:hypothetical protein